MKKMRKEDKYLEDYTDYLTYQRNYSTYTINNYKRDIIQFFDYLNREGLFFLDIEYNDTRLYLMYLKDEISESNSSIDRKLSALRSF